MQDLENPARKPREREGLKHSQQDLENPVRKTAFKKKQDLENPARKTAFEKSRAKIDSEKIPDDDEKIDKDDKDSFNYYENTFKMVVAIKII